MGACLIFCLRIDFSIQTKIVSHGSVISSFLYLVKTHYFHSASLEQSLCIYWTMVFKFLLCLFQRKILLAFLNYSRDILNYPNPWKYSSSFLSCTRDVLIVFLNYTWDVLLFKKNYTIYVRLVFWNYFRDINILPLFFNYCIGTYLLKMSFYHYWTSRWAHAEIVHQ